MSWVVNTMCTPGPYEGEAHSLARCCKQLSIACDVVLMPDQGHWQKNVRQRFKALEHTYQRYPGCDVLHLDADSLILYYPKALDNFDGDIGVVGIHSNNGSVMGGTVFIKNNDRAKDFMREVGKACDAAPVHKGSMFIFQRMVRSSQRRNLKVVRLPPEYGIIAEPRFVKNREIRNPVIIHTMASCRHAFRRVEDI